MSLPVRDAHVMQPQERLRRIFADIQQYVAEVYGQQVVALSLEITLSTCPQTPIRFPLWPLVPLPEPERNGTQAHAPPAARHSPDFRSINWFGTVYSFTEPQAAAVRILWEAWQNGTPDVSDRKLREVTGTESANLRDAFRECPAWGTVIREGGTRGTRRLVEPGMEVRDAPQEG